MEREPGFLALIRDVLAHFYDYPYLQSHKLSAELGASDSLSPQERMLTLRTVILEAIEEMKAAPTGAVRSVRDRAYHVLHLYYVEGLGIEEVSAELAISERQVYRELRKAEGVLATLLWKRHQSSGSHSVTQPPSRADLVLQEAARLPSESEEIAVQDLLRKAVSAVSELAAQRAVEIRTGVEAGAGSLFTSAQVIRQVMVSMLSHALQIAQPHSLLSIQGQSRDNGIRIQISFSVDECMHSDGLIPVATHELIKRLGGHCSGRKSPQGMTCVELDFGRQARSTVLVIDDNQALVELFQRYLAGEGYNLISARGGKEGLRLSEASSPDVVVLDVMLPDHDGWEILQRLRNQASTMHIPVIVCSVFDEPELAKSLGASAFLSKPVTRNALVAELARCIEAGRFRRHPESRGDT